MRSEFTYDFRNRRVSIVEKNSGLTLSSRRLLWCEESLCEERDTASGAVVTRFEDQGFEKDGTDYFYTRDHLGSIREVTDSAASVRVRYTYDPHGRRTKTSGDVESPLGFTGHYFHSVSQSHLTWFRSYDAEIGRWLTEDPLGLAGGQNRYAYVEGNPTNYVDLLGLSRTGWPGPPLPCYVPRSLPPPPPPPGKCRVRGGTCVEIPDVNEPLDLLKPCIVKTISRRCKSSGMEISCEKAQASGLPRCRDEMPYMIEPVYEYDEKEDCDKNPCDV